MTSNTTYLITGANRGIGLGLLETYLARPNNTVIAAVRDPENSTVKALSTLPKGSGSSLVVVKIDSSSENDAKAAMETLRNVHKITALDVVIANAGIATIWPLVIDVKASDIAEHVKVNTIGPVLLFQAVLPLLSNSKNPNPRFIGISSVAGSIGDMEKSMVPNSAYGTSKAALNYVLLKMHYEHENITVVPLHPGWVQTELGDRGARSFGLETADTTIEESVKGMVPLIDNATRKETSGKFLVYDGSTLLY